MKYFAGLDVSLEWTSACVVDEEGRIVREAKVLSEPDALVAFFVELGVDVTRIGLEAGPLSQWLHDGLAEAGLPVVCAETRQLKAVLSATVPGVTRTHQGASRRRQAVEVGRARRRFS